MGDVSGWGRDSTGTVVYSLTAPTVEIFTDEGQASVVIVNAKHPPVPEEDETSQPKMVKDAKGREITEAAWNTLYGTCSYCTGDCDHETAIPLVGKDAFLCQECANDVVVRDQIGC